MNHPWSSWKEHYKKNSETLDPRIDQIVVENGYTSHSRTAYLVDRRLNGRVMVDYEDDDEVAEAEEDGPWESQADGEGPDEDARPRKKPRRTDSANR